MLKGMATYHGHSCFDSVTIPRLLLPWHEKKKGETSLGENSLAYTRAFDFAASIPAAVGAMGWVTVLPSRELSSQVKPD